MISNSIVNKNNGNFLDLMKDKNKTPMAGVQTLSQVRENKKISGITMIRISL